MSGIEISIRASRLCYTYSLMRVSGGPWRFVENWLADYLVDRRIARLAAEERRDRDRNDPQKRLFDA